MSDTHSYKCPHCGGNLVYSVEEQMLMCSFCGNGITADKLALLSQINPPDQGDADENEERQEITCNSCGAKIIADKNTSATFCAFCGSPSLVTQRLTKRFRPDYVIPFKITREEALSKIKEFAGNGKYAPKHFFNEKNIKKLTGIYVPFWLMDSECNIHTQGIGYKEDLKTTEKYSVISEIYIRVKNVPFDGALNMRDELMESVEPYDCSELKPFNGSYLQGYYAQRYDLSAEKLTDRIMVRLQRYGKQAASESLKGYDRFQWNSCMVGVGELEQKYALFPVWLLTYEYKGKNYQIAVNAQTGKTDGYLPVDKVKTNLRLLWHYLVNIMILSPFWAGGAAIVLALKFWSETRPEQAYAVNIVAALACMFVLPLVFILFNLEAIVGEGEFGKISPLHPLRRAIRAVYTKRAEAKRRIIEQTDMMIGDKPPFSEYYDPAYKAEINNDVLFMGRESIFEDERL